MQIKIEDIYNTNIAELISDKVEINNVQDALDIMMNCIYQGAYNIIIHKQHLISGFFDLKTKVAGEILQKFSNYSVKLAIVGDFSEISSKSLRDFICESNKQGCINFVNSIQKAKEVLCK